MFAMSPEPPGFRGALPSRRQAVLIVDDEQDILDALRHVLGAYLPEVEVVLALTAAEGIDVLRARPIDLIVTDYKLPGMNGLEFLEEARRIAPQVPRILITAFPDVGLAIDAINREHILNFIAKPLDPETIAGTIGAALAERKAQEMRAHAFANALTALRREVELGGARPGTQRR